QDNNASLGSTIQAGPTSTNSGNNTNWNFGGTTKYWVANVSSNWNNSANWALTSGGPGGASLPNSLDQAIFDGNGGGTCTVNTAVTIATMTVSTSTTGGYTATIDMSGYSLTVSSVTMRRGSLIISGISTLN